MLTLIIDVLVRSGRPGALTPLYVKTLLQAAWMIS